MSTAPKANIGACISGTLFWVFMLQFALGLYQSSKLNVLHGDYNAPANLRSAADRFQSSLSVEQLKSDDKIADFRTTEAWKNLEKNLDGYATRLEIMQDLDWTRQILLNLAYLGSALAMFLFTMKNRWVPEKLTLRKNQPPPQ
ncbi:hypothetical protein DES53_10827 [Roseimicrobium gellanilyticum]|uniref:Uncharacterized protein n=1 Tax=Roseimicrobium gellanilyticum TaxID=748857 RepID=A0A366HCY7_9BACT|nr:hypothetical protein [Roseimicrobium gellanilyticum]RBP40321.1 hypothetical protein DES53_10827 [Roseimicrobium gellanilyticum]